MQGIEILNQIPVYVYETRWWIFFVPIIISSIVGLVFAVYLFAKGDGLAISIEAFGCGILVGLLCGLVVVVCGGIQPHPTDEIDYYKYQVTISNEVNFNEFNDKYEIIGQEGSIFTIKEREQ